MKPLFQDRICAVVAASTAREMEAQFRQALRMTRTLELRLDWLRDDEQRLLFGGWFAEQKALANCIATCRRKQAGGLLPARGRKGIISQLFFLSGLTQFGCDWCDVEAQSMKAPPWVFQMFLKSWPPRPGRRPFVIVSWHVFAGTPPKLSSVLRTTSKLGPHATKIATQCNSLRDALRVLDLCKGRRDVIAVPMGEIGLPARVLALKHGSALAYAAAGEKTAPGQLTLGEMKNLYRADKLDRRTKVYGVIGNPVAHSLSPLMHNTGFIARKVNAVYLPFLVKDLRDFLEAIQPLEVPGFSVTLPWKEKILRHLDDCDPLAERIGAVNTVIVRGNGKLYGRNTDYVGVLRALERKVPLAGSRVLILGAGGAARAVAFALAQGGAIPAVCSRRPVQAKKLASAVGGEAITRRHLRREFFDAIVNTTPVGMSPRTSESPLNASELNTRLVFDAIYRPMRTRLLQLAERRGIETVSGLEMFVAQGTAQWEIWTGERAPVARMRAVVLQALRSEARKQGKQR